MKRRITKDRLILPIVILLVLPHLHTTSLEEDENAVSNSILRDIPIQLLSDEETLRIYRESGYRRSRETLSPQLGLLSALLEEDKKANFDYTSKEALHVATLIRHAFNLPYPLRHLEAMLKDKENQAAYLMERKRIFECCNRIYKKNDRSPEIEGILKQCLAGLERIGYEQWSGKNLEALADYYFSTGQDEKGLRYLERAFASYTENDHLPIASHLAGRIGAHHVRKGNLDEAEKAYMTCLDSARRLGDPYYLGRALSFLGLLRATEGYFVEAESLLVQSLEYCDYINDPICNISKYLMLARFHNFLGEPSRASYLAEKAVLIAEESFMDASSEENKGTMNSIAKYLARSLALFAGIQLKQGDPDGAILNMERAVSIARDGVDRHFAAELEKLLGDTYSAAGRNEEAKLCYLEALKTSRRLNEKRSSAEYLTALAALHSKNREYETAEELLSEALVLAEEENYWMQAIESLRLLGETAVACCDYSEGKKLFEEAISIFDRQSAGKRYAKDQHSVADEICRVYCDLLALESDVFNDNDSLIFWAEKARHKPIGHRVLTEADLVKKIRYCIAEREWIPENAVIIQHLVTPDKIIMIAMDRHGTTHHSVEIKQETIERDVLEFINLCHWRHVLSLQGRGPYDSTEEMAAGLYRLLIEPLSAAITDKDILCFIEDGILRYLPLGALLQPGEDPEFLIERHSIMFSPSLIALNPRTNAASEMILEGTGHEFRRPLLVGEFEIPSLVRKIYPYIEELPHTGREILSVARLLPHSEVLRGSGATKEAVLTRAVSSDLIHIAAHTVNYPVYGGKTAIVLSSPGKISGEKDLTFSLLTEEEISRLDLSGTKLVVLSACESASGKPSRDRRESGLAGSFLNAGVPAVVATLWPVGDLAAEKLITDFFRELMPGKRTAAGSLRQVQMQIINGHRSAGYTCGKMNDWAPFIFVGAFEPE